ncbi:lysoplasmalogenase [Streptomyces zagrosensis]|uniref:Putative membrane protein YhhN n=1 Tax=Streptomyces zagrosensis TaxID=1042984 RepID=A0A7W9UWA8_9ACTN|nr:lysoplasmalogenase [Streptomyces zagrosensis]MBB5933705.1 putative membrane protein YhhN [Streptomyces zagrosensis]
MSRDITSGERRAIRGDDERLARVVLLAFVLLAFVLLAAVHLLSLLAGVEPVEYATKPALMPVLAGCVVLRGGPRLLVVALFFGCGGDTLLQLGGDLIFLAGMGSFAAGHGCYLVLFARRGPVTAPRRTVTLIVIGYATAWLVTVAALWPDLESDLRVPVAVYSLLLTAMALGALRVGVVAGVGGALFLLSDTLIAAGLADWPELPVPQFWIMLTYLGAQVLLARGLLGNASGAGTLWGALPGTDETARGCEVVVDGRGVTDRDRHVGPVDRGR